VVTDEQVAAMLSELTGRRVRHQGLTDEQVVAGVVGRGMPPPIAQVVAGFGRAAREGLFDVVTDHRVRRPRETDQPQIGASTPYRLRSQPQVGRYAVER
jgi:hypothetical protein